MIDIRRERKKVRIILESEEIILSAALFVERPLRVGEELDPDEYDQWLLLRQYRPALNYAVSLLAARAHATGELRTRLLRAGYRPVTADMVLCKLQKHGLTDDKAFARQWVEARTRHGLGPMRIRQELRRKGFTGEEAGQAAAQADPETQLREAVALAGRSLRRGKPGEDPRKQEQRALALLARHGYPYTLARKAVALARENGGSA